MNRRTRLTTSMLVLGVAGSLLVACGDDEDDDLVGGQNAPGSGQTVEATTASSGNAETDTSGGNTRATRPPIRIVDATPITRSGSDGSMATNNQTASPEASPVASPEATPAG